MLPAQENFFPGLKTTQKKFAALNKAERSWRSEEHFDNTYGDEEFGDC